MPNLIIGVLASLILSAVTFANELQKENPTNTQSFTLWKLIEILGSHPSLAPDKIKQVLSTEFSERRHSAYTLFYDGGPLQLAEKVGIDAINLRVRIMDETQGLVTLSIADACVTLEQVRVRYPNLIVTDHPRGHSLDEQTYWTAYPPWGELSFGFKERNPECLASVVIDRSNQS